MSGGIFDYFSPQGQGSGILGSIQDGVVNNRDSLMGAGLGLMSGNMETASQGYMQGQRNDALRRQQKLLQDQEIQKRTAAQALVQKYNIPPELATDPDSVFALAKSVELKKHTPKEYGMEETYLRNLNKTDPAKFGALMDSKYGAKSDQPTEVKEYQFDMQQRKSMGQPAVPYQEWIIAKKGNENKVMAGDRKVIYGAEDENLNLDSTISTLKTAQELNGKTFTGWGSSAKANLGTSGLPGTGFIDQDKAKATSEFNKIMGMESIKTMANTLKGATTDFELNKFVEILADPNTPPDIRKRTIERMQTLAERKKKLNDERINEISGGTYFKNRAAGGQGQGGTPNATPPSRLKYNPQTGGLE